MKRFPILSLGFLVTLLVALVSIGSLAETHCSFGFGGMGCIAPFVGWGETFLIAILVLIGLAAILAVIFFWRLWQWARRRRTMQTWESKSAKYLR